MDYENIAEEFVSEVNYCNYARRRRTVSETEPQNLLPHEVLFRRTDERSSAKSRFSQSVSPPRPSATASNNGCMSPGCLSPGDVSMSEDGDSRWKGGSSKMAEWLSSGQSKRRFVAEDQDVEMGEPPAVETEFRRRAGSHGLRDLLRIRPRCNSHGEKRSDADSPAVTPGRGSGGNGGNVTPLSPGTATGSSSASSSTSSSVSRFRVFLDAFRHRANSDSLSHNRTQLHGWSCLTATATSLLLLQYYYCYYYCYYFLGRLL